MAARLTLGMLALVLAAAGGLAPGRAAEILSPKRFPVWQAYDVCFPFVLEDPGSGEYRMYYTGTGADQQSDAVSDQWATGLVTSRDTLAWTGPEDHEPVLFPRRYREGELVEAPERAAFDAMFAFGAWVVAEPGGFRIWYTGWSGEERRTDGGSERAMFRVGLASSADGRRFTKIPGSAGAGAVLGPGPGPDDALGVGQPAVLKDASGYRMWYEGYDGRVFRIFLADSADGLAWRKGGLALSPGGAGSPDELGLRNPVIVKRGGAYELWYQGRSAAAPEHHVLRATSADGRTWTKARDEVALHPRPPLAAGEALHVDSVLPRQDGTVQVFFARQVSEVRPTSYGPVRRRGFRIYTELVRP